MSGCSDMTDCPRCLGKGTLDVYTDWKPFDQTTGQCLRCGFTYYYKCELLSKKDINDILLDFEDEELTKRCNTKYSNEEKQQMKDFDEMYEVVK
jgi:hypothetical protein